MFPLSVSTSLARDEEPSVRFNVSNNVSAVFLLGRRYRSRQIDFLAAIVDVHRLEFDPAHRSVNRMVREKIISIIVRLSDSPPSLLKRVGNARPANLFQSMIAGDEFLPSLRSDKRKQRPIVVVVRSAQRRDVFGAGCTRVDEIGAAPAKAVPAKLL
jgi:hypothetical protein